VTDTDVKGFFSSRTVWAGALAFVAGVAALWGYSVSAEDTEKLIVYITGASTVVGSLGAIYYRVKASKKIG
jgi:hypothetical protein